MNVKYVVFDLDGTLLDTLDDLYLSVNKILADHGYPSRSKSEVRSYLGNGVRALVNLALPERARSRTDELLPEFKAYYDLHKEDNTAPYDGIKAAVAGIKAAGIKCAIVSNKFDAAVRELKNVTFSGLIDFACGEREGVKPKPAPDGVFLAMREIGANPAETVYVGDSEVDLATAQNSGLKCVAVSWGFRDRGELVGRGAKNIVDTPAEMKDVILSGNVK